MYVGLGERKLRIFSFRGFYTQWNDISYCSPDTSVAFSPGSAARVPSVKCLVRLSACPILGAESPTIMQDPRAMHENQSGAGTVFVLLYLCRTAISLVWTRISSRAQGTRSDEVRPGILLRPTP